MNRLATIFTLSSALCISTTASAQQCANGICRLPGHPADVRTLRGSSVGYQRPLSGDYTVCRDGQCGLHRNSAGRCDCDGRSCNCIPESRLNNPDQTGRGQHDRREYNEPLAGNQSRYRQTNFSAPVPPLPDHRPAPYRAAAIQWNTDFRRAADVARRSGRPMLVSVTAQWCGYCTKMKQETFRDNSIVRDIDSTFVAISLDADQNQQLVQEMGVQSLPATLVISPDMRIVDREQGFRSARQLSDVLRRHLQRAELETDMKVVCR